MTIFRSKWPSPIGALIAVLLTSVRALAQDASLPQMTIEDLMHVEVQRVFGASERLQPVTEAPSSVTIITADDIVRYSYHSLADILRGVRGFYVIDDRNYSYVGVRGFLRPGDYSTKVLLLVNGRRVNDNVYDQAAVGRDFGLDVSMFDRVEIIRGPASSLYGTSAFFAVVNVITKTGAAISGLTLTADAGSLGTEAAGVAFGRRLENGVDVAVSANAERTDGVARLSFPGVENGNAAVDLDGESVGNLFGHVAIGRLSFTGTFGSRTKSVPTASFGTIFNSHSPDERTTDVRLFTTAQYDRPVGAARLTIRGSFDRYTYDGIYPYLVDGSDAPLVQYDSAEGRRWGAEARVTVPLPGRQTFATGAEFFDNIRQNQWDYYTDPGADAWRADFASRQGAVYVQDEIKAAPWLLLNGGLRYDNYADFQRVTPRAAVVVMPTANQSFKYLYGRAFRAPNAYEEHYFGDNQRLSPESIRTHELVWEQYTGSWLRTSVSSYWYDASGLITLAATGDDTIYPPPYEFFNLRSARAFGAEFEAEVRTKRGLQAVGSYSRQRTRDDGTNLQLSNSPRHLGQFRVSVPGPAKRSFASMDVQYVSERGTIAGGTVPSYAVVNGAFSYPLGETLDLVVSGRNLFNASYSDPASDEHAMAAIPQNGRTVRVTLRWTPFKR